VEPDFANMLFGAVLFSLLVLGFIWWRFGLPDMLVFIIVVGLFSAIMDFISSFVARNYEYPGQSPSWVFTYIFFGWMGMCGSCLFIAEGILASPGEDTLSQQGLWWRVPLLTAAFAMVFDLFIDPLAVAAGYWIWFKPGSVYYGIPLLNYVGWFVLMFFAPLAWILIVRKRQWASYRKIAIAFGSLLPLFLASVVTSVLLNGVISALGLE
jgi:putative membrane protein